MLFDHNEPLAAWEQDLLNGGTKSENESRRIRVETSLGRVVRTFTTEEWDGGVYAAFKALNQLNGYNFKAYRVVTIKHTAVTYTTDETPVTYL